MRRAWRPAAVRAWSCCSSASSAALAAERWSKPTPLALAAERSPRPRDSSTTPAPSSTSTATRSKPPASRTSVDSYRRIREAGDARRPEARDHPHQRRNPHLRRRAPRGQARAAHAAQDFPGAAARSAVHISTDYYQRAQGRAGAHRRATIAQALVLQPRTIFATATSSGPTSPPGCCSRRAWSTRRDHVVEQFAFTQLVINTGVTRDSVRSELPA